MRMWFKTIGVLAGGLLGLGGLQGAARAQFGGPPPAVRPASGALFANDPMPPTPPEFPNPGSGGSEPVSPFSVKDEGMPNAFTCLDTPPAGTPPYRLIFRGEYLNWRVGNIDIPASLATTSLAPNLLTDFGAIGQPNTVSLLGPGGPSYGPVQGARLTLGIAPGFVPPLEVSGFTLNRNLNLFAASSNGTAVLARPVQLANQLNLVGAGTPSVFLSAFPGVGSGSITAASRFNLWATDVDMFFNFGESGTLGLDAVLGYKHAELRESFNIQSTFASLVGQNFNGMVVPAGFSTRVIDDFAALNRFDGATLGLRNRLTVGPVMLMTDAKLALGNVHQVVNRTGTSTLIGQGGSLTVPGGILALASNGGPVSRNDFAIIPELNVNVGYQLTGNLRVFAGYNLMYWSSVARAANQIDTFIDSRQAPTDVQFNRSVTGLAPPREINTTTFFAHGFSVGIEFGF
jgi:Putative beta barrel porin-7 (BBP7)